MENSKIDEINKLFKCKGYEILTRRQEIKKVVQKLECIDEDGYLYVVSPHKLKQGRSPRKFDKYNPFTLYNLRLFCLKEKPNYKVITYEGEWSSSRKVTIKHMICGNEYVTTWDSFYYSSRGMDRGCFICYGNKLKTHDEFISDLRSRNEKFKSKKFEVVSAYIRDDKNVELKCNICGHRWDTSATSILSHNSGCMKCFYNNNKGENNASWNPNLTDEERESRRVFSYGSHALWRSKVFERDEFKCRILNKKYISTSTTGKKYSINAHHMNGYHWDKENRFNVNNGITLSEDIHKLFHRVYGMKNNTRIQMEKFIEDIYKGIYDNEIIYGHPLKMWIDIADKGCDEFII